MADEQVVEDKEMAIGVGIDLEKKAMVVQFSEPLRWLSFSVDQAKQFAAVIIDKIRVLEQIKVIEGENAAKEKTGSSDSV